MSANELKRIKGLEAENAGLKRVYAESSLLHEALKEGAVVSNEFQVFQ